MQFAALSGECETGCRAMVEMNAGAAISAAENTKKTAIVRGCFKR
jgi:hypothetical protein